MPKLNNDPTISEQISPDGIPITPAAKSTAPAAPPKVVDKPVAEVSTTEIIPDRSAADEKIDETIDFTKFLEAKEVSEAPGILPKKEEKSEEKPVEQKIEAKPSVEDKPAQDSDGRDYSDFSEEEKPLFKRMSNDSFNRLKPIYLEHRRLKAEREELTKQLDEAKKGITKIPENYYEHPQAFVLTPEFATASNEVAQAEQVFNHWANQLSKIREGAKEVEILGRDAQGNFVITNKIPADTSAETELLKYFTWSQQQLMGAQANVKALAKTHNEKYQNSVSFIQDFEKKSFPVFDSPEGKPKYDPLVRDTINKFPAAFRNNPLSSILAKSLVTNLQLAMLIQQIQKNGATVKPASAAAKIGPSAGEAAGEGGDGGKDKSVSYDDFERVKQGV